ncbi:MAG TPA: RidA family protein [Terriglobales bacterium]|jgi:2-iminobutanoate/2-iminopropanoate deaminase|nr:RidA family protein [Terriglobales bacterium]
MVSTSFTRRKFAATIAPVFSALGVSTLLGKSAEAKKAAKQTSEVRKLNDEGKPADGTQFITPIVEHNGLIYIAGQGAHDSGPADSWKIDAHTTKVLDNVKKLVETGGSNMDNIVQLGVFLAKIEDYDGMNKVFKTYFPHGGPARTTVAVAALPGNSLVEINCSAAVVKK